MASGQSSYAVEFTPAARKQLLDLERSIRERISTRIDALADNPRPHGAEKLKGNADRHRIRIGDYRVVYEIHANVLTVVIVRVGHRRDVYRP